MASIFSLKTDVSELSSANSGMSKMEYSQFPPTRDVTTTNFANGNIHFRFETSGTKWWIPSKSYLRMRVKLTKGDDTPLDTAFGAAPNMGLMSNLFQSGEFKINDKVISRVPDFMPQIDALETRLTKSKSWVDSIGASTNWWQESQALRLAEVSNDGEVNVDGSSAKVTTTRLALGFVATNNAAYDAATGVITFSDTGAGALPADVRTVFPAGSFFVYTAATNTAASVGVAMKVITGTNGAGAGSATTIVVEPILPANETGAAAAAQFSKIVVNSTQPSRRANNFEMTWTPPLSLFKIGHAMPGGKYELSLTPQSSSTFQQRAIESILGQASKDSQPSGVGDATKIKLSVVDFYLYCATVDGPRVDDMTYLLDLEQTRCQSEKIATKDFGQRNFDVSPSTFQLTAAFQDLRAGTNTAISASKFKSYEAGATPSVQQELKLDRFFINYAGQNLPAPDADPQFVAGTDYTTQRYTETQIYSGGYFDTGGVETIQEFHDRGAYYTFQWPKDGTDRSTRVNVHSAFGGAGGPIGDVDNMRLLLFDHSKQVARIKIESGRVTSVEVEES